jgi:hypothetical protein
MYARATLLFLLAATTSEPAESRRVPGDVVRPAKVELIGPSGVIKDDHPTFSWKVAEGAEEYLLEVRGKGERLVFSQEYSAASVCGANGVCSVSSSLSELTLADGKYVFWVRARNALRRGPKSDVFRFAVETLPPAPDPPVLLMPGHIVSEKTPRFVWKKQDNAVEYLLEITRNGKKLFSQWLVADQKLCPDETCSFVPDKLVLDYGRYNVRARAKNSGGTSRYSRVLRFRVVLGAPVPLAPLGPAPAQLEFQWTEVPEATYYILRVANESGRVHRAELRASDVCTAGACSTTFPALALTPGSYVWWVRGGNPTVRGMWSEKAPFQVGASPTPLPGPTTALAPTGVIATAAPSYRFQAVPEATHYAVHVMDANGVTLLLQSFSSAEAGCAAECVVTPAVTLSDGAYRFTVTTSNVAGSGPSSAPLAFEVDAVPNAPPPAPILVSPSGIVAVVAPSFVWEESAGATSYTLVVEDAAGMVRHQQSYTLADALCAVRCAVTPPLNLENADYLFRVQAENASGAGPFGGPLAFTVSRSTTNLVRILSHGDGDVVTAGGLLVSGTVDPVVQSLTFRLEVNGLPAAGPRAIEISRSRSFTVFVLPGELAPGPAVFTLEANDGTTTSSISMSLTVDPFDFRGAALLTRATFGATPALLEELSTSGASALQDRLLNPIPDPAFEAFAATLPTATSDQLSQKALLHAVLNPNQLLEVMTQFWDNHFSTDLDSHGFPAWELSENVQFRGNALGRFRDLLEVSAKSPAMLHYLDQTSSTKVEPNENYPREVLELHTLGVDGPYVQRDVEALARILTGWKEQNGQFFFDSADHDSQSKTFLGQVFPAGGGLDEGERVLDILAGHPSTSRFVCFKLAELLVSEAPSSALVSSCAAVFQNNHLNGNPYQLREVVAHLLESADFASPSNFRAKAKTPLELVTSTVRNLDAIVQDPNDLERELRTVGMSLFHNRPPDGFAEEADEWIDTSLLLARVDLVNEIAREAPNRETWVDLRRYFQDRGHETAEGIVGYLFGIAFQNEFTALELGIALDILSAGGTSAFDINATDAETRLRRLVGTVLSFPGYQHQ